MLKHALYFRDERGRVPVREFIGSLPPAEQAKVYAYIAELKAQGHNLRRPLADYVTRGIYELRPKGNRVFYFFYLNSSAVLVHAIRKKTDKLPERDVALALKRKAQVEECRNDGTIEAEGL